MKKIFYISILVASTVLTSCDDLFEPATENQRQLESMYKEPSFAQGILANAYILLPYQTGPQSDLATDDAVTNNLTSNYLRMATGSWAAEMNPIDQWRDRYNAINYCNIMLANCDKVKWAESDVLNTLYNDHFKGESYALRALNYFYLLRAHAGYTDDGKLMGVPIILTPQDATMSSDEFNRPRDTFKACIDQINADLDLALSLLQYEDGSIKNESDVPAKYAAIGATMGDYNRAFGDHMRGKINGRIVEGIKAQVAVLAASPAYADESGVTPAQAADLVAIALDRINAVVPAGGNKWFSDHTTIDNLKAGQNPAEILWRAGRGGESEHGLEDDNFPPSMYGKGRVNPTQNFVDAFPMKNGYPITADKTKSGYDENNPYADRDPRLEAMVVVNGSKVGSGSTVIVTAVDGTTKDALNKETGSSTRTGYYLRKLLRQDINLDPNTNTKQRHYKPRLRYTEFFLNYAEAANEAYGPTGKGSHNYSAYDVIKAIRKRAGVGLENGDAYLESIKENKDKMRELIRNERRIELSFEGFRFWDIRRWGLSLTETAKGMSINNAAATYGVINVDTRNYKDYQQYGPIPYSEVLKYSNLQQNQGW